VNRHVITSDKTATDIRQKLLDYVIHTYNVDSLKHIIISGDGANWIRMSSIDFDIQKGISSIFVLDRFHMHQAINHISKDENIKYYLREYLKFTRTKSFRELCNALIIENPHREDIIAKYRDYILSNWMYIKHQSNPLYISHILAALFTSRPKAHSLHMITKRLRIRELLVNKLDIKSIYLSNHVNPIPQVDYMELNQIYPTELFDVLGHKVTEKYKSFKRIAHPRFS